MTTNWNIIEFDIDNPREKIALYDFFLNGSDYIRGCINKWNNKTPLEITIEQVQDDKKFIQANYCEKFDRIEIHYIRNKPFTKAVLPIKNNKNCIINCTKIIFIYYEDQADYDNNGPLECLKINITQPGHKKGSIIVGNP